MAINFPSNPSLNEPFEYTTPDGLVITYRWDGDKWLANETVAGGGGEGSTGHWKLSHGYLEPKDPTNDVSIGTDTFRSTIEDAVLLLPREIIQLYKAEIEKLPKAEPYGATTLPADTPKPLRDALEKATTAGKINLNADGSASFASNVGIGITSTTAKLEIGSTPAVSGAGTPQAFWIQRSDSASPLITMGPHEAAQNSLAPGASICSNNRGLIISNTAADLSSGEGIFFDGENECARFYAGDSERMRIDAKGNVLIGGTLPDSPKISLNSNGSATFSKNIQSGGNAAAGAQNGAIVTTSGFLASSDNTAAPVFRGYTTGNATPTSQILANGSATFAGGNITLNAGGFYTSESSYGHVNLNVQSGALLASPDGNKENATCIIGHDGSATFAQDKIYLNANGSGRFKSHLRVDSYIEVFRDDGNESVLTGYAGGAIGVNIAAKGSATFKGDVYVGGNNPNQGGGDGTRIWADGRYMASRSAGYIWEGYTTGTTEPTSTIGAAGSATFAAPVTVGDNPNVDGDYGVKAEALGKIGVRRAGLTDITFASYPPSGASPSAFILANGSATYTGDITAPNVTFTLEPDNPDSYTTTTEEYTETEYYTVEVPVIERPGVGTADLVDGDERETQTITKSREVTKTREVKTYTGPTLDVRTELLALRERAAQQDAVIAEMSAALKALQAKS